MIGILIIEFNLQACHSLKEKRQTLRSLTEKIKKRYNIAISETNHHDLWQLAEMTIVNVHVSSHLCREHLDKIVDFIASEQGDFQIISHHIKIIQEKSC